MDGKLYTDYPFIALGDKPNKIAPIRELKLLSYDGDKYCKIEIGGKTFEIKAGYIYKKKLNTLEIMEVVANGQ